jgi:hypothetical protein
MNRHTATTYVVSGWETPSDDLFEECKTELPKRLPRQRFVFVRRTFLELRPPYLWDARSKGRQLTPKARALRCWYHIEDTLDKRVRAHLGEPVIIVMHQLGYDGARYALAGEGPMVNGAVLKLNKVLVSELVISERVAEETSAEGPPFYFPLCTDPDTALWWIRNKCGDRPIDDAFTRAFVEQEPGVKAHYFDPQYQQNKPYDLRWDPRRGMMPLIDSMEATMEEHIRQKGW